MLLEWTLATELYERRSGLNIRPVCVGTIKVGADGQQEMQNLFAERPPLIDEKHMDVKDEATGKLKEDPRSVFDRVPAVVVASVYKELDDFLQHEGLPPRTGPMRTAHDVVSQLKSFLVIDVSNKAPSHGGGVLAPFSNWGREEAVASVRGDVERYVSAFHCARAYVCFRRRDRFVL